MKYPQLPRIVGDGRYVRYSGAVSDLNMDGKRILNLPSPSASHEPATKGWVESLVLSPNPNRVLFTNTTTVVIPHGLPRRIAVALYNQLGDRFYPDLEFDNAGIYTATFSTALTGEALWM